LIPFIRRHRAYVVAGLTYHQRQADGLFVNAATWLIPTWSEHGGFRVVERRQGKQHLARQEEEFNAGETRVVGHRPCQWLVAYPWDASGQMRPLHLTASVCYDATDLRLAADLRDRSDVFIVPSLNRDVATFDQMALALHYHMYQMVVVANNGFFGGSNAYQPVSQVYERQVFHLHGQPQGTVAFLEIDDVAAFLLRGEGPAHEEGKEAKTTGESSSRAQKRWKHPPAGRVPRTV
jgi:hypothetical protein